MRSISALRQHAAATVRKFDAPRQRLFDGLPGIGSPVHRWVKVTGYTLGGKGFLGRLVLADGEISDEEIEIGAVTYPAINGENTGQVLADCLPPVETNEFIELRTTAPPGEVVGGAAATYQYWAAPVFVKYGC